MTHRHLTALAAVLLLAATGCGETRPATGSANDCSACHAFPPTGIAAHATAPGGTWEATECAVCHGTSVDATTGEVIPVSAGGTHANGQVDGGGHAPYGATHGAVANQGLAGCQECHGDTLDDDDALTGVSCNDCHAANGAADWQTDCTFCHGGDPSRTPPNATAASAPPYDVAGSADTVDVGVGAHERHVDDLAYGCTTCHEAVPADALAAGHVDGDDGSILFGGLAVTGSLAPTWDHAAETCATTYCHGGGFAEGGGANTTPVWTSVGTGQADCGDCHALPIPDPAHPQPFSGSTWLAADCSLCHAASVDGTGTRLAGHLDGATTPANPLTCTSCHPNYPTAPYHTRISAQATSPLACSVCHDPWRPLGHADGTIQLSAAVSCTSCHGAGDGTVQRNAAPPVDVYGGNDVNRVGAHAAHLDGKTYSEGFSCGTCHSGAGSYTPATHIDALDGTANLVFTGLGAGTVYETDRTCSSSYCHGGTLVGGTTPAPSWSGTISCNSCHGSPPATGRHASHVTTHGATCATCHTGYTSIAVNTTQHVNGDKDVSTSALVGWDGANCTTACHTPPGARSWYP